MVPAGQLKINTGRVGAEVGGRGKIFIPTDMPSAIKTAREFGMLKLPVETSSDLASATRKAIETSLSNGHHSPAVLVVDESKHGKDGLELAGSVLLVLDKKKLPTAIEMAKKGAEISLTDLASVFLPESIGGQIIRRTPFRRYTALHDGAKDESY